VVAETVAREQAALEAAGQVAEALDLQSIGVDAGQAGILMAVT
jgi:hypothetical protein